MSAGSIPVPIILPLKAPGSGSTGARKWMVDTETLIDIQTTRKDAFLFYTLNGSKPDPFKKIGDKTTYQYTKPIKLKAGKMTIKAIAVLRDGSRESSVNTKVFQVSHAEVISDDDGEEKMNTTWESKGNDTQSEIDRSMERSMFKKVIRENNEKRQSLPDSSKVIKKILTDSPPMKLVDHSRSNPYREEDAMRCLNCNVIRPSDPYARFCPGCSQTLPPAPGMLRSQMLPVSPRSYPCEKCHTMLPIGSRFCSACETSVRHKYYERFLSTCSNCGSNNQNGDAECVVCDQPLPGLKTSKKDTPKPSKDFVICPLCSRVNSGDARFCDWCGKRPGPTTDTIACQRCFAQNMLDAQYCCTCGKVMLPPTRKSLEDTLQNGDIAVRTDSGTTAEIVESIREDERNWRKVPFQPISKRRSKNAAVQVGDNLSESMSKVNLKNGNKLSPGKGYWRQQIEHILNHLKIYTQNNIDFRESLSNHIISGLQSAVVSENIIDSEITVTATFAVQKDAKVTKKNIKNSLSGQTLLNALASNSKSKSSTRPSSGRSQPSSAANSRPSSARSKTGSRPGSARKKKRLSQKSIEKEKIAVKLSKLSDDSLKLLNLVKSNKDIDLDKMQDLVDADDADINLHDENGLPLLKLCIQNKHFDIIETLLLAGVDIDGKSGPKETTALHEAVMLGLPGKKGIEILLQNGASPDITDKKERTPYDLALETGSDAIINNFTKHTTSDLLKDVMKL